ncbi:DUF1902 domain-containing protein [Siccirubricoccus phaeus]|uniref:DUF1902 domain-containing protein n=1 Tax=Siccirubricoccus phaeus TaxID=2595053 RepID=UPI0011F1A6A4|nr:DUF1902 domain-containing protein [Siccirubricoccus phaeus]
MPKVIVIQAEWDDEAHVWWASSKDVPGLVSEASTFEGLSQRILAVLPEVVDLPEGAEVEIHGAHRAHLPAAA